MIEILNYNLYITNSEKSIKLICVLTYILKYIYEKVKNC